MFESYYLTIERNAGSGTGQEKILTDAFNRYQELAGKAFKHYEIWERVRETPKLSVALATDEANKRCKTSLDGAYSSQSRREGILGEVTSDEASTCRSQPEGSKMAKAKAKRKKPITSSDDAYIEEVENHLG